MPKGKYTIILLLMFLSTLITLNGQKSSRQSATGAFDRQNYEAAYEEFSDLLATYPRDPLYKYYSAVCLVNLNREPEQAGSLLEEALNSNSLKSLPDDALFYLARTQQMKGDFDSAIKTYNRFSAAAGRKRAKELNVSEFINQCKAGSGKVETARSAETLTASKNNPVQTEKVTSEVSLLPANIDAELGRKLEMQYKVDSAETNDRLISQAPVAAESKPVTYTEPVSAAESSPVREEIVAEPQVAVAPQPSRVIEAPNLKREEVTEITDTTIKIRELLSRPADVYSVFEVLPQPVADPRAVIEINPQAPEGLIYRIQVAVFRNPVQLSYFKGISPIYGIKAPGATVTIYYAGVFRQHAEAVKSLASVRSKGFKDSFVVAQMNNKNISQERAGILEKEWGDKPLFGVKTSETVEQLDTLPPTLLLKVEITRSIQPLKEDAIEPMRRIAGKRSFDMLTIDNGSVAYLIGNFITFESAEEFADLLKRNGYKEAKVVAWLGKREIDIQTARQLFETLK